MLPAIDFLFIFVSRYFKENNYEKTYISGNARCGGNHRNGLLAAGSVTNQGVVTAIGPCANTLKADTNTEGIYVVRLSNLSHTNYFVQITPQYDANDGRGYLMPSIMSKTNSSFTVRLQSTNGGLYQEPFDFVVYGSLT